MSTPVHTSQEDRHGLLFLFERQPVLSSNATKLQGYSRRSRRGEKKNESRQAGQKEEKAEDTYIYIHKHTHNLFVEG